jgi:anti-sigma B factor antagonist
MSLSVKVVEPSGILDAIRGNDLRREINDIATTGADIVLIDLKNVNFIDSSGLGALVSAKQILKKANTDLFVCSVNDQVRIVFELTKMDRILPSFTDRNDFNSQIIEQRQAIN